MAALKFLLPSNFSFHIVTNIIFFLEGLVLFIFILNLYLYYNFLPTFSDFYYFSLFFLHVPISWISLLNYICLLSITIYFLVSKDLEVFLYSQAFVFAGLLFTGLTIFTGMLWGLPLWGLLFAFDARFITVIVLLLFYIFYIVLFYFAKYNKVSYTFVAGVILFGGLNIPLIKYSVDWWNTLHQASSITQLYGTVHYSVYIPLLLFFLMFLCVYSLFVLLVIRYFYVKSRLQFFAYL